jgi:hypothetical protein
MNNIREMDSVINTIDSFNKYTSDIKKNQLFSNGPPPLTLVNNIFLKLFNKDLNKITIHEFTKKNLIINKIPEKIEEFIPELKKYYIKCKYTKYLDNLDIKKIITIFRQLLKPYNFFIHSVEKYGEGEKYILYVIEKRNGVKKIEETINFD